MIRIKKHNHLAKAVFLIAGIILALQLNAQQSEIRMQSVFLYNFTRLVSWPADYQQGDFVMAVYGSTPMLEEIESLAATRKAGTQNIVARKFNSINELSKCHIIYIPRGESRNTTNIVNGLKEKNIKALIVTDSRNSIKSGAVINFTIVDGKQRFELSQENAKIMGLTLGGEITRLAILVD